MDGLSACMIETRIVFGLPGAGKTSYILGCIRNDYFHKYGTTLILCFERGQEPYDLQELQDRNTYAAYYDGSCKVSEFCSEQIRKIRPDRIYVEMNARIKGLAEMFPDRMKTVSAVTLLNWPSLEQDLTAYRQEIREMVSASQQVIFRDCPSKELLSPYSQQFRVMNRKASYLRQDPMGYHERAFDRFVPYSLESKELTIRAKDHVIFWLDAADHPEHYEGKRLSFPDPLELRQDPDTGRWSAGRVVMTCCMADLQFMSLPLSDTDSEQLPGGWITMLSEGQLAADTYGQKILQLKPLQIKTAAAPKHAAVLQIGVRSLKPDPDLSQTLFRQLIK